MLPLESAVADVWPPSHWTDLGVVVAVSGGADSVALLRILQRLSTRQTNSGQFDGPAQQQARRNGRLIVAHYNHGRRGDASNADEDFVAELAAEFGIEFVTDRQQTDQSDEAAMAGMRRQFLRQTAMRHGARYVAMGHHADDNVETLLHHLFRGSGPAGLCGMTPFLADRKSELVWARPMLDCHRVEIRQFLASMNQSFCDDSSNRSVDYTRNWIRHDVLPIIRERFENADQQIASAASSLRSWRTTIDQLAMQWLDQQVTIVPPIESSSECSAKMLIQIDPKTETAVVIAAMQMAWDQAGWLRGQMDRDHWSRLAAMIRGFDRQARTFPGDIDSRTDQRGIVLAAKSIE